jgi:hypothetical protein
MVRSEFCVKTHSFALVHIWLGANSVRSHNFALEHANFVMYTVLDFIQCMPLVSPICHTLVMLCSQFCYVITLEVFDTTIIEPCYKVAEDSEHLILLSFRG